MSKISGKNCNKSDFLTRTTVVRNTSFGDVTRMHKPLTFMSHRLCVRKSQELLIQSLNIRMKENAPDVTSVPNNLKLGN